MKTIYFFVVLFISNFLLSCNMLSDTKPVNADSLRADSLWKVAIADSINRARNGSSGNTHVTTTDTASGEIETISRGIEDGLNKVQDGLNKVRKITEVSANSRKAITDGINKTKDAVNKTIEEARRTINSEPPQQQ